MYIRRPHITITGRRAAVGATAVLGITAGLLLSGVGQADEPLKEGEAHMKDFAYASQPQWNFHKWENCWPESAFGEDGNVTEVADGDCDNAKDDGAAGEAFPTYYTAKKCKDDEIRVSYTLYFGRVDGEDQDKHDFETVIVKWKNENGDNWSRDELLTSDGGDWDGVTWGDAESWNAEGSEAGHNKEYPRIWVENDTHGLHNSEEGGTRGHDYRAFASKNYDGNDEDEVDPNAGLIEVEPENGKSAELYNKFKDNADAFGDETWNPAYMADNLCEVGS
jgi:hypothetical protein